MLPRLTGLRIFGALAVFIFHLGTWEVTPLPPALYELGYVGVAFFFVLSGFVLAWGTRPGLPAGTFYRRRFARVWPSHVVMLLVAALLPVVGVARGWTEAAANVVLVQAWFAGRPDIAFGMNGVSWSLSCEAFFYATFPLTVIVLRRIPRWAGWSLSAIALLLAVGGTLVLQGAAVHLPVIRYSEFLLGVVAGLAVRDGWRPQIRPSVAGLALVAGALISSRVPAPMPDTLMAPVFLLVLLSAAGRDLAGRGGWLSSRALVFAGEASFAFYLVHELVIVNLRPYLPGPALVGALLMLSVATMAAVALHLLVERPCHRLLRGRAPSVALQAPDP